VEDVLVAVPWAATAPEREAALGWVARQWGDTGLPHGQLVLGLGLTETGEWCKALGVEHAITDQPGDILVISDADVFTPGVVEAIERVRAGAPWVIPHHKVHRLNPLATRDVLDGRPPHVGMPLDRSFGPDIPGIAYAGVMGGGIVVLRRDVYEDCPLDPRFVGWGQEDESWGLALRCLHGPPARLSAPLWHLWHPPQPRMNRGTGSDGSAALYRRYSKARRRPDEMRALIAEGRTACSLQPR
jgi:hypothetical protein